MSIGFVLLPLFVQVALTFVLLLLDGLWLPRVAAVAARRGASAQTSRCASRTGRRAHADRAMRYHNQFELPVLFYVLTILVDHHAPCRSPVRGAGLGIRGLSRLLHAYIHVTSNDVHCAAAFSAFGALVLLVMWLDLHRARSCSACRDASCLGSA